jgi:hypothetical protein
MPAGRMAALSREESPGSMEARCRVTPGEGDLRESATESKPPRFAGVRVKGCGKSAPRVRQRTWQGKPHREQNLIGTARARPRSRLQIAVRVGCSRHAAMRAPEEWPSRRLQNLPYRTRLTGRLADCCGSARRKPGVFVFRPAKTSPSGKNLPPPRNVKYS